MRSLLLSARPGPGTVAGIVEWFGAMQAQDMASGLWSLGVRLPGSTAAAVTEALERREAIRTWPMRGTVHLVPPADAHWMLDLMGVRALAGAAKRRETIGLAEKTADRGVEVLAAALAGGGRLTRAECLAALAEGGVELSGQVGYHLLWYASQRGVTCIAPHVGKEQTFVLLDEWVPAPHRPSREEALATIALRYFRSHGPATKQDFARWTGLTLTDTKAGIAGAGDALTTVRVDGSEMVAEAAALDTDAATGEAWWALPGFDEYMLGYKDRGLLLDAEHFSAVVPGGNGVFQATIVHNGRTVATWKRTLGAKAVTVEVFPLAELGTAGRGHTEQALRPYAAFVGLPLKVRWR
ncbi:winged helix DNA-binding domain-containing protein [Couchioplanes caeruleus]|uniref:winged helix DNA-binding domain-containing protein n=1 Tax=Couchioplanes caeruleus TaxID=56438 RepID=UPI0020BE217A|nr:winged helix DNA-binding domain-containing protein [Couchioplanes caeruleus]UQU68580.1 winged helix DNA-binding domain-containing protein [Couchioplanes caeruleus]